MAPDDKTTTEREYTDASLQKEREKTDQALAEKQAVVEDDADEVIRRARDEADTVLIAARDKADQRLNGSARHRAPDAAVAEERVIEDRALREDRASADETLRRERDDDAHTLSKLLPLERQRTDRYLLTERARSDTAVSHRDDFLGIVSHDLRNLLGGIVMSTGLVSKGVPETEEGKQTLVAMKRIQRYAARMNRLIGDLLDVASIDAGMLSMMVTSGDPTIVMADAVDTFRAVASEKGIALETETRDGPLLAEFDYERMLQVFANLITNSIKFTSPGGSVRVYFEKAAGELRFGVTDTGPGIPSHMLEAIFERFWQVGHNDRRGTGLGLYISKCIVEAHGGRIWAESKLGDGCTVYFTLPVPMTRVAEQM